MSYYDEYYEGCNSELPEFLQKISDIVDERVEELLVKKVADIDSVRKKQAEYKDIIAIKNKAISERSAEVRSLEHDMAKMRADHIAEVNQIKSATVFDYLDGWGDVDKAYYLESDPVFLGCPVCGGKETIEAEVNGVKVNAGCPLCNPTGKGRHDKALNIPKYNRFKVKSIDLKDGVFLFVNPVTKQVYPVTHIKWDSNKVLNLTTAFKSEKEAKEEADKRTNGSMLLAIKNFNYHLKQKGLTEYIIE